MSSRYYPLYQRGNPQLRVFLPNFWMKIIRPREPVPPNVVQFITSIEMTEHDVRNYLEKIYKVPVVDVRTTIKMGRIWQNESRLVKDDDYKEALVFLPKDYKFEYPDVITPLQAALKTQNESLMEKAKEVNYVKPKSKDKFLPSWFS